MCGRGERVCNGVSFACTPFFLWLRKGRESLTGIVHEPAPNIPQAAAR